MSCENFDFETDKAPTLSEQERIEAIADHYREIIRLIGDDQQLASVAAGGVLRDIDSEVGAVNLTRLISTCAGHGSSIGIYAERLLDDPLPWTRMRAVYRLLGLVRRYGNAPVEAACTRALDLDVVSVTKIASMLERATEDTLPLLPTGTVPSGRFARQPAEFATGRTSPASAGTSPASHRTPAAGGAAHTLTLVRDDGPDTLFEEDPR